MKTNPYAWLALICLAIICLVASGAPFIVASAAEQDRNHPLAPPGDRHLLGTDTLGRDEFSRLLHAARISIAAGALATALTLAIATVVGGVAGYFEGLLDHLLSWCIELVLSVPWIYLVIALRALLPLVWRPAPILLIVAAILALTAWPRPARLIRGVVLSRKKRPYVTAARAFGASHMYLIRRHILPATQGLLLVQATLLFPRFILAEVTLSFLGFGSSGADASLGVMLWELRDPVLMLQIGAWAPVLLLIVLSICCQTLADLLGTATLGID